MKDALSSLEERNQENIHVENNWVVLNFYVQIFVGIRGQQIWFEVEGDVHSCWSIQCLGRFWGPDAALVSQ